MLPDCKSWEQLSAVGYLDQEIKNVQSDEDSLAKELQTKKDLQTTRNNYKEEKEAKQLSFMIFLFMIYMLKVLVKCILIKNRR